MITPRKPDSADAQAEEHDRYLREISESGVPLWVYHAYYQEQLQYEQHPDEEGSKERE